MNFNHILGIEFYKCSKEQLSPILHKLFDGILESDRMSPSTNRAVITLLLKLDKDLLDMGGDCPLSLLNCDYKIFVKILATLEKVVL